jgi:hypothetical protein
VERNNQYQYWVDLPFNTIKNKFWKYDTKI